MTDIDGTTHRDLERLSAFLDGELSTAEAEKLAARLKTDEQLSGTLEALRATAAVVGGLPDIRPPKSFALTEEMVRPRRAYPILQLGTAMAALGFVLVVGADLYLNNIGSSAVDIPEQAFFAADELASQAEERPADASPAAAPGLEEAAAESGSGELAAAAEPQADSIEDADVLPAQPILGADEAAAGEARAEQGAAEPEAVFEEQPAAEGALKADGQRESLTEELPAQVSVAEEAAPFSQGPLRVVEIGLAAIVILLLGLTLWVRQRG